MSSLKVSGLAQARVSPLCAQRADQLLLAKYRYIVHNLQDNVENTSRQDIDGRQKVTCELTVL